MHGYRCIDAYMYACTGVWPRSCVHMCVRQTRALASVRPTWVQVQAPSLSSWITLEKLLDFSESLFFICKLRIMIVVVTTTHTHGNQVDTFHIEVPGT